MIRGALLVLLSALSLLHGAAGCASTASVQGAPAAIARATEPAAESDAARDSAPDPASIGHALPSPAPRSIEGPAAAAVRAALSPPVSTALQARELARIDSLLACASLASAARTGTGCAAEPLALPLGIDDASIRALLSTRARDPRVRRASSSVARALIEQALAPGALERAGRRRSLTFLDERARFAFDDASTLLAQCKRDERRRMFAAARPAFERSVDIAAEERSIVSAAAARVGLTRGQLLARRAGVDEATLRALVEGVLAGTAPLLAAVASDVTLLADVRAPVADAKAAAAAAAQARAHADPLLVEAVARAAGVPRGKDAVQDWARLLIVDVRRAALSVTALLEDADANRRDLLASRILMNELADEGDVVTGAGLLLSVDETGAVVERFAALLSTPALARLLAGGARPAEWIRAWAEAPPLEERGHPEAFIEVLKVLPELATR